MLDSEIGFGFTTAVDNLIMFSVESNAKSNGTTNQLIYKPLGQNKAMIMFVVYRK